MNDYIFSTVAFVPSSVRDDRLNVGVIVLDPAEARWEMMVLRGLRSKLRVLGGGVEPWAVEDALKGVRGELEGASPNLLSSWSPPLSLLHRLNATWVNQIQISAPRRFRADSFSSAVSQLTALHLGGPMRRAPNAGTRREVRQKIKSTIATWNLGPYRLDEQRIRQGPDRVSHQADFWLVNGREDAALYAFAPDSELNAIVLRDSMPSVLASFQTANADFQVVAVTTNDPAPEFTAAADYLQKHGIVVTTTEQLGGLRSRLLRAPLTQ